MQDRAKKIKQMLNNLIHEMGTVSWMYSSSPGRDFTRDRKLPFEKIVALLLGMRGGSLANELMDHFGCTSDLASVPAFVQQRQKLLPEAMETLFHLFVEQASPSSQYKGFRLFAVDGSDIHIPTNPSDPESYYPAPDGHKAYNLLHLNAMYDLLSHTYVDALVQKHRLANECGALNTMVDRSCFAGPVIVLADRGFESYNVLAHIQEKGWHFLIRIKDPDVPGGFACGLDLPSQDDFDRSLCLHLTRQQTNEVKKLRKIDPCFKFLSSEYNFDFLPKGNWSHALHTYEIPIRIVRFQTAPNLYETVITNLPPHRFPPDELKALYAMRWGIETSFRQLKYTVGLLHFHAKKMEHILQEIFAHLIMYDFSALITSYVIIPDPTRKFTYRVNFSAAVHICRAFLLGDVSPPLLEALLLRYILPVRPGRTSPRRLSAPRTPSFNYRLA